MNNILKRDEYVNEIYNPMMEQKHYEELKEVNEGLLKNLFGIAKNLFKRDWETIKGDKSIIAAYKEMDDKLTGFSMMKLSKKEECNKIRQELVDFACDWYDLKMNKAKESETDPKPAKSMKFKNDTLRENLSACEKKIKEIAGEDQLMQKWADTLLNDMKVVINKSIIDDINDEETKKELEKQFQEDIKDKDKANKMLTDWENEQLKEIQDERNKFISDAGADPDFIKEDLLGGKAIQNICGKFNEFQKETDEKKRIKLLSKDSSLGFGSIFTKDDYKDTDKFNCSYQILNSFYTNLSKLDKNTEKSFTEVAGRAVYAMCIALNAFVRGCVYGGSDYGKQLPLMAKCAIVSDGTVSYNLPLNKKGDGNYFTEIASMISQKKFKDTEGKDITTYPNDFKKNSKTLFDKIINEAEKLKKEGEKKREDALKKLNLDKE